MLLLFVLTAHTAEPVLLDQHQLVGERIPKDYRPDYPYDARRRHITGNGVFILHVDPKTGFVHSITVQHSTGSKLLDDGVLRACIHWQFKPHTVTDVKLPIAFSMGKT